MAGNNSIAKYTKPTNTERDDAAGITQFGGDGTQWTQTINGIIVQGGRAPTIGGLVSFIQPFPKQLLGIFVSVGTITAEGLTGFTASVGCYYLAIGV